MLNGKNTAVNNFYQNKILVETDLEKDFGFKV